MKKLICMTLVLALALAGCVGTGSGETTAPTESTQTGQPETNLTAKSSGMTPGAEETVIKLSDDGVLVNGVAAPGQGDVYTANDIVYYEAGHDFTYGEGDPGDAHDPAEAGAHTVVHITKPGVYRISGKLSAGQIAVDLGPEAKSDPGAVVTLILDGVDITCTVAPAVIFYNVYECGVADEATATAVVDTSAAGANVVVAGCSVNIVNGSYVARIYKEGTVVLDEDGDEVADAKKLHKYDAAFYSKMSMNVDGEGILAINAENEGLDSELHLTINGGDIRIRSGNDGINTNEDNVSVTTINGGRLIITVTGTTGEGDGIDSNGYLVINGGTVIASACGFSGDAGIDSDLGIYLNGGTVMASGHMLDRIAGGEMNYAVFQFSGSRDGGQVYTLKNQAGDVILECSPENSFTYLLLGGDGLAPGSYSLWAGETRLAGAAGISGMPGNVGMPGELPGRFEGDPPEGEYEIPPQPTRPVEQQGGRPGGNWPEEGEPPELPEGETWPEGETRPGGMMPGGMFPGQGNPGGVIGGQDQMTGSKEASDVFEIVKGGCYFVIVGPAA